MIVAPIVARCLVRPIWKYDAVRDTETRLCEAHEVVLLLVLSAQKAPSHDEFANRRTGKGKLVKSPSRWFPLILFVCTRAGQVAFSYVGMVLVPNLYEFDADRHQFMKPYPAFDGLCRWDCSWFLRTMRLGFYERESAKVFPLYPAVSWCLSKLTGWHDIVCLLIVANLSSLIAYFVIYRLFREIEGEKAARWGLTLLAAYPFSFYHAAAYSEPMMLLGSAAALLLAAHGKHVRAGFALGLGMMARHVTVFFGAGLLVYQVAQRGLRPKRLLWNAGVLGLTIPFVFLACWAWYLGRAVGDPFAFWTAREINFGPTVFWSVREVLVNVKYDARPDLLMYPVFSLIPLVGTLVLFSKKRTLPLAFAALAVMLSMYVGGGIALGRYSGACWPAFLPYGRWLSRHPLWQGPVLGAFMLLQGLFLWLYTHQWHIL